MTQPAARKPLLQNRPLLILLGLILLLACLALVVVAFNLARPQLTGLFVTGTPTPPCVESRLAVGSAFFRIQPAPAEAGSSLSIPAEPGVVYWLGGENPNYVLVFNPDRQNQVVLGTLKAGLPISVNWEDCSAGVYNVEKVEVLPAFDPARVDPKLVGVTLYLPLDATGRGLVVTARLVQSTAAPALGTFATY